MLLFFCPPAVPLLRTGGRQLSWPVKFCEFQWIADKLRMWLHMCFCCPLSRFALGRGWGCWPLCCSTSMDKLMIIVTRLQEPLWREKEHGETAQLSKVKCGSKKGLFHFWPGLWTPAAYEPLVRWSPSFVRYEVLPSGNPRPALEKTHDSHTSGFYQQYLQFLLTCALCCMLWQGFSPGCRWPVAPTQFLQDSRSIWNCPVPFSDTVLPHQMKGLQILSKEYVNNYKFLYWNAFSEPFPLPVCTVFSLGSNKYV